MSLRMGRRRRKRRSQRLSKLIFVLVLWRLKWVAELELAAHSMARDTLDVLVYWLFTIAV
jgi:hypothetical protein